MDNILVGGKTKKECMENLMEVLKRIEKYKVKINEKHRNFSKPRYNTWVTL